MDASRGQMTFHTSFRNMSQPRIMSLRERGPETGGSHWPMAVRWGAAPWFLSPSAQPTPYSCMLWLLLACRWVLCGHFSMFFKKKEKERKRKEGRKEGRKEKEGRKKEKEKKLSHILNKESGHESLDFLLLLNKWEKCIQALLTHVVAASYCWVMGTLVIFFQQACGVQYQSPFIHRRMYHHPACFTPTLPALLAIHHAPFSFLNTHSTIPTILPWLGVIMWLSSGQWNVSIKLCTPYSSCP